MYVCLAMAKIQKKGDINFTVSVLLSITKCMSNKETME